MDFVIDDQETSGFRIVFRQWPEGYDPLAKGGEAEPAAAGRPLGPRQARAAAAEGLDAPQERQRQRLALSQEGPP